MGMMIGNVFIPGEEVGLRGGGGRRGLAGRGGLDAPADSDGDPVPLTAWPLGRAGASSTMSLAGEEPLLGLGKRKRMRVRTHTHTVYSLDYTRIDVRTRSFLVSF